MSKAPTALRPLSSPGLPPCISTAAVQYTLSNVSAAAPRYINPYNKSITDPHRRTFAGMISALDEGLGNVTAALAARGMLDDTLIFVTTDNVCAAAAFASPSPPGGLTACLGLPCLCRPRGCLFL